MTDEKTSRSCPGGRFYLFCAAAMNSCGIRLALYGIPNNLNSRQDLPLRAFSMAGPALSGSPMFHNIYAIYASISVVSLLKGRI